MQNRTGRGETNWHLKVNNLLREKMRACSKFQMDGAEIENAREAKLLAMPEGLARRFVLEEHKALDGR